MMNLKTVCNYIQQNDRNGDIMEAYTKGDNKHGI
jgi:hypothetical protein